MDRIQGAAEEAARVRSLPLLVIGERPASARVMARGISAVLIVGPADFRCSMFTHRRHWLKMRVTPWMQLGGATSRMWFSPGYFEISLWDFAKRCMVALAGEAPAEFPRARVVRR